jgi:prevent-host-death family protein
MKSITASEAKMHFSELLERVWRGERITITRYGVPTALLVPASETPRKLSHREVVEGMRALRQPVKRDNVNVRELINEGRHRPRK